MDQRANPLDALLSRRPRSDEPESDFPGRTPPRNRPGGEYYEERERAHRTFRSYTYKVDGEEKTFYTIQTVAAIFNRSPITIRSWEDKGWFPRPRFRSPAPKGNAGAIEGKTVKGRRLYSQDQVDYLMMLADRFNMTDPKRADWAGFRAAMSDYPST